MEKDNIKAPGGVARGLSLWLDGNDASTMFQDVCSTSVTAVSADGHLVRCWKDKSGLGNHMEAPADGNRATYNTDQANARALLTFAGAEYYTGTLPQFSGNQAYTIFVVKQASAAGAEEWDFGVGTAANDQYLQVKQHTDGNVRLDHWNNAIDYASSVVGKTAVYTFDYDGDDDTTNDRRMWANGSPKQVASGTSATNVLNLPATPTTSVGGRSTGANLTNAEIAEIVVYDRQLEDHEREDVEAYLAQKWFDEPYYRSCPVMSSIDLAFLNSSSTFS